MIQDILHAVRQLRRSPGFSVVAICVIALGIGANTAIFSLIDAVILKPLPYADPDRLVMVWETRPDRGFANNVVSAANYVGSASRRRSGSSSWAKISSPCSAFRWLTDEVSHRTNANRARPPQQSSAIRFGGANFQRTRRSSAGQFA